MAQEQDADELRFSSMGLCLWKISVVEDIERPWC